MFKEVKETMLKELKENIVIKQRLESYEFDFILAAKNLILKTDPEHRTTARDA